MQREPLIDILSAMKGTDRELDLSVIGENGPLEIRNVVEVQPLVSANGIRITTKQNQIWLDASHVSVAWQVRTDL